MVEVENAEEDKQKHSGVSSHARLFFVIYVKCSPGLSSYVNKNNPIPCPMTHSHLPNTKLTFFFPSSIQGKSSPAKNLPIQKVPLPAPLAFSSIPRRSLQGLRSKPVALPTPSFVYFLFTQRHACTWHEWNGREGGNVIVFVFLSLSLFSFSFFPFLLRCFKKNVYKNGDCPPPSDF